MDPATRHLSGSDRSARAGLAEHQVQVDRWSPVLLADHQEADSFRRPDREGRRVVHEVLISCDSVFGVARQSLRRLLFRSDRSGHGDVVLGEGDANRHAETEDRVEEAQHAAEEEHEHEAAAAGQTPAATWTETPGLVPHSSRELYLARSGTIRRRELFPPARWKLALTASRR